MLFLLCLQAEREKVDSFRLALLFDPFSKSVHARAKVARKWPVCIASLYHTLLSSLRSNSIACDGMFGMIGAGFND
jgi:hypothetical protein